MDFDKTQQSTAVMGLDLASTTGTQQLHQHWHFQFTDHGHGPLQIHQSRAPDAACDHPSPHITSPVLKDCYNRWSPTSWF